VRRDRATWVVYAAQSLFGFVLYGSGAITALVRAELDLGYLASGALAATFTSGAVLGAALSGWLLRGSPAAGRELRLLGVAAAAIGVAAAILTVPALPAVALGLGLAGLAGGSIPPAGAWLLARRHGEQAGRALLEVNVLGALAGVLAAGALSGAEELASWRLALVLPVLAGAALCAWALRTAADARTAAAREHAAVGAAHGAAPLPAPAPADADADGGARRRLPGPARWYIGVAVAGGVLEFGVLYWAADLLVQGTGLTATRASGSLVAFTGGLVVGRAAMSVVATSLAASRRVLRGSLGLAALGAVGLLAAAEPWQGIAALAVVGLGTAALYPVALALAVAAAGGAGGRASSLLSVAVGLAALVAPVLLAAGADRVGMGVAFLGVPLAALLGLLAAVRAGRGPERPA
jgi:MFS family permease